MALPIAVAPDDDPAPHAQIIPRLAAPAIQGKFFRASPRPISGPATVQSQPFFSAALTKSSIEAVGPNFS